MALEDKARGQRIAALRKQRRLTQQAMAERLGIAYRTYQTWEAGQVMPEWPNLEKLAEFFEIKPESIIGDTPDLSLTADNPDAQLERIEAVLEALDTIDERLAGLEARLDTIQVETGTRYGELLESIRQLLQPAIKQARRSR